MNDSQATPVLAMYRTMLTIRRFEERCNYLYMQGKIPSTLHLYIGQEAVATGVCAHLKHTDYLTSTHRPHGHAIAKGVSLESIMAELFGKATGCCKGKGGSMHVGDIRVGMFPAIAIVGAGIPIAAGAALALKRRVTDGGPTGVAVSFFGDGAANEGAFHEGLNMAAIWDLPVIYICENNLYAASTPFSTAFKIKSVVERAPGYGIPAEQVDGNDVLAVYEAAGRAIARARAGGGPTLLECLTYRQCGHSRSDPRTYPIQRLGEHLIQIGQASQASLKAIEAEVTADIDAAVAFAEASPLPLPTDTLTDVFYGEEVFNG
jgi:TPP-dependent pyruvate/acetoin dehydrogenase alpha subunit